MKKEDDAASGTERQPYFQTDFDAAEFVQRRSNVIGAIGDQAIALIAGSRDSGSMETFRQHNDFYYLCGVEVPHAYLLIDGRHSTSTLYLPPCNPRHERSEGATLCADDGPLACRGAGVDDVKPLGALVADLKTASVVYTPRAPAEGRQASRDSLEHAQGMIAADPWDGQRSNEERFRQKIADVRSTIELRDLTPVLDDLRLIKSPQELVLMRRAGRLTALAVTEALRCTEPGRIEYELAAVADYVYALNGARGGGYRPIVACGDNIWNAHYFRNNCPFEDGQLVLMDYAPDVGNYTSDIGRMWPVNGRYSDWQRELYGFIVEYHKILLSLVRAGVTPEEIYNDAAAQITPLIESTDWSKPSFEKAARNVLTYNRHLTHPVGMAVHDVGEYREGPLQAGVVFALDPQLWVPEERLYIRVEDTVVITEDGVENLTDAAPLELDDMERMMQEPGLFELRPDLAIDR